jgi:hypothetical protein
MKLVMLVFTMCFLSLAWAQSAAGGVWLGKIEDAAHPCRQYHLKLELKQDTTRPNGISGDLFFRTPQLTYVLLGNLAGTAQNESGYLDWHLRGNLKPHSDLPKAFADELILNAVVMPMPPSAPPGTPAALAFIEDSPLPMRFVQTSTAQAEEQGLFDRLDFLWAMQLMSVKQTAHLAQYSMDVARVTPSQQRRNELVVAETLKIFRSGCKNRAE